MLLPQPGSRLRIKLEIEREGFGVHHAETLASVSDEPLTILRAVVEPALWFLFAQVGLTHASPGAILDAARRLPYSFWSR